MKTIAAHPSVNQKAMKEAQEIIDQAVAVAIFTGLMLCAAIYAAAKLLSNGLTS